MTIKIRIFNLTYYYLRSFFVTVKLIFVTSLHFKLLLINGFFVKIYKYRFKITSLPVVAEPL